MTIDTGFDDVLAGEVYTHPDPPSVAEQITVAVNPTVTIHDYGKPAPHVCASASGGTRCDTCFGPIAPPVDTPSSPSSSSSPTTAPSVGLTPSGVQAAKALIALPPLTWPELSKLAREIAMDIKERGAILAEFKLNDTQYEFLEANNDFYKSALAAACKDWHAPMSTAERIKVEAAAILEDSLIGLGARMQNKGEGLPGVIEAAKLFAKVAGVGEREGGSLAPGERFTINIDLGGDQKIVVSGSPAPVQDVGGAGVGTLLTDGGTT